MAIVPLDISAAVLLAVYLQICNQVLIHVSFLVLIPNLLVRQLTPDSAFVLLRQASPLFLP